MPLQQRGALPVGRRRRPDLLRDDTGDAADPPNGRGRGDRDVRMRSWSVAMEAHKVGQRVSRRSEQGAQHRSNVSLLCVVTPRAPQRKSGKSDTLSHKVPACTGEVWTFAF